MTKRKKARNRVWGALAIVSVSWVFLDQCGPGIDSRRVYTVAGILTNLSGTLVLNNNLSDTLSLRSSGAFTFSTALPEGTPYSVTVTTQPSLQYCSVTNGSGTIARSIITNITANCLNSGLARWAATATATSSYLLFRGVATDASGNIYATGNSSTNGVRDFGNGVTATGAYNGNNALLVKYNSSGVAQWAATTTSASSNSTFYRVATDPSGNIYGAGFASGNDIYGFGNGVTAQSPNTGPNPLLVKYNSSGVAQWAATTTNTSSSTSFRTVATDTSGNVYAAGYMTGATTRNFGNGVTASGAYGSGNNSLLVKYNSSGVAQWAATATTASSFSEIWGIATDGSGNVYVGGHFVATSAFVFGNGVTTTGPYDGFQHVLLVKYNSSGVAQWAATTTSGTYISQFLGVATDASGNIYAAGSNSNDGDTSFGNGVTVTSPYDGFEHALLVKYNSSGVAQWAKTPTSTLDTSKFNGVATDSSGNVYLGGSFYGNSAFGLGNGVTATGPYGSGNNSLLIKYNSSGVPLWVATPTSAPDSSSLTGVATDASGSVYGSGGFNTGVFYFGNGVTATVPSSGGGLLIQYTQ